MHYLRNAENIHYSQKQFPDQYRQHAFLKNMIYKSDEFISVKKVK